MNALRRLNKVDAFFILFLLRNHQPVWPNWAIFERFWLQIFFKK